MRILGLDYGTKTLGIAVSDLTNTIATSLYTFRYESIEEIFDKTSSLINEYNIDKIVLGYPKNMNNSLGESANKAIELKKLLEEKLNIEVCLQDERLTSVTANRVLIDANISRKKRKGVVDKLAATIILQNYLDINKRKE
ncbi:MAG TPA: Holliday junction resolvase RuvX [Bacilli bacterium]|mgnify:CR=1 FL=1|nr:Holliday junction resolvase RuvX [Bacilli bacterium]